MSRIFNSSLDYLGSTSTPRPWWPGSGTAYALMNTFWASGDGVGHQFIVITNTALTTSFTIVKHSDNVVYAGWTIGGSDARITVSDAGLFTSGTELRSCVVDWDDVADLQHLYLDNTLIGSSTIPFTVPVGNADSFVLGSTGSATPWSGAIAELARWNRVLTAAERATLEATRCPLYVPQGLVAYFPLIGRASPEIDLVGGANLPVNGSPVAALHPRVLYPTGPYVMALQAAGAPPSIHLPLIANTAQIFTPSLVSGSALQIPLIVNTSALFPPTLSVASVGTGSAPVYEGDRWQIRAVLEAWNLLTVNGLTDTIVAGASTVEEIEAFTLTLHLHEEMMRPLYRARLMLRRAEELGILTDSQIAAASTVDQIHDDLMLFFGDDDGDSYSAFFQGT